MLLFFKKTGVHNSGFSGLNVQICILLRSVLCAHFSFGPVPFFWTAQDSVPGSDTFLAVQQCRQKLQLDWAPLYFSIK
jgi:hypothetical protein